MSGTGIKLFPAEIHHCRLSDQLVIPPSPETVNILRVEPRSTRALIPQHGAHCRATPLGDLSPLPPGPFALHHSAFPCTTACQPMEMTADPRALVEKRPAT